MFDIITLFYWLKLKKYIKFAILLTLNSMGMFLFGLFVGTNAGLIIFSLIKASKIEK